MNAGIRSVVALTCRHIRPHLSEASILCYHSVGDNGAQFTVTPTEFEKQIAFITAHYTVILLSELVRRLEAGESVAGCVCITFDDGYKDNVTVALPILEKYNVTASVFMITSRIGKENTHSSGVAISLMSEMELKEAQSRGMEILPHTHTHRDSRELSPTEYQEEFDASHTELEKILGVTVPRILAYPKGRSNEQVQQWLSTHRWIAAVGTRGGIVSEYSPRYDLERNGIRSTTTWEEFRMKLSNGVTWFERIRRLL